MKKWEILIKEKKNRVPQKELEWRDSHFGLVRVGELLLSIPARLGHPVIVSM